MASIYDEIIRQTFANPALQTEGWVTPPSTPPSTSDLYEGILPTRTEPRMVNSPYARQGTSGIRFNLGEGFVPGPIPTGGDRLPQGTAGLPSPSPGSGLTPQQLQALGGWAVDPRTGQLAYSQPSQNSAVQAATVMAGNTAPPRPLQRPLFASAAPSPGPGPQPRPGSAPTWMDIAAMAGPGPRPRPDMGIGGGEGASPGMGGAMIGNGQMASSIPPQGPPPPGIAPTVWADEPARAPAQRQPQYSPTSALAYALMNASAADKAKANQAKQTGTSTSGYVYQNGQRIGVAPWAQGLSAAQQYDTANARGQQAAKDRQASLTGVDSMGRVLKDGKVVGTTRSPGQSSASVYAEKAAKSVDRGTGGAGGNPTWW